MNTEWMWCLGLDNQKTVLSIDFFFYMRKKKNVLKNDQDRKQQRIK